MLFLLLLAGFALATETFETIEVEREASSILQDFKTRLMLKNTPIFRLFSSVVPLPELIFGERSIQFKFSSPDVLITWEHSEFPVKLTHNGVVFKLNYATHLPRLAKPISYFQTDFLRPTVAGSPPSLSLRNGCQIIYKNDFFFRSQTITFVLTQKKKSLEQILNSEHVPVYPTAYFPYFDPLHEIDVGNLIEKSRKEFIEIRKMKTIWERIDGQAKVALKKQITKLRKLIFGIPVALTTISFLLEHFSFSIDPLQISLFWVYEPFIPRIPFYSILYLIWAFLVWAAMHTTFSNIKNLLKYLAGSIVFLVYVVVFFYL